MLYTFAVPSAAPSSVSVSQVTLSTIIVRWEDLECIHRNGNITGYSVLVVASSVMDMVINVDDVRQATISELTPFTEYTISVAAVNTAGMGVYSNGTTITIKGISDLILYYQAGIIRASIFSK